MSAFKPKLGILPKEQIALWPHLGPTRGLGFTLYGGTAIALRLGHRPSVDFDFFASSQLNKDDLRKKLPFLANSEVIQDAANTLTVISDSGVKLSFFGGMRFGRYGVPDTTDDGIMSVASLDDLMAHKIKVIHQRSELKDYTDLAEMLKANVSLSRGMAIAVDMFKPNLSPIVALKTMTYFEGGDVDCLPEESRSILVKAASYMSPLPEVKRLSDSLGEEVVLKKDSPTVGHTISRSGYE